MTEHWDIKRIAEHFGVGVRTVREKWTKRPGFPAPSVNISRKTRRWEPAAVMQWATGERR